MTDAVCPYCGAPRAKDATSCPFCGEEFSRKEEQVETDYQSWTTSHRAVIGLVLGSFLGLVVLIGAMVLLSSGPH